jgi:sec-independent protein translocase protein TatB
MIDFGFDKLMLIGAVALVVLGPERLPKVARTVGVLVGKAQRYMSQVQSEVNRSIELEELRKMKTDVQTAASNLGKSVQDGFDDAQATLQDGMNSFDGEHTTSSDGHYYNDVSSPYLSTSPPVRKNWRLKRGSTPLWYKQREGVRRHVQSGAARVARFRPPALPR